MKSIFSYRTRGTRWLSRYIGILLLVIITTSLSVAGCAINLSYYSKVRNSILKKEYQKAVELVEKGKDIYGEKNSLLYYMDAGVAYQLLGDYEKSNSFFAKAEDRIDYLYTKSISQEAASFVTNEYVLPYRGEDFERVFVNLLSALNYVAMERWDDALVECRKVDHKLNLYNIKYEKKNIYKEDAFIRLLIGMLYESQGEINDAFIAYRKALDIYRSYKADYGISWPSFLRDDLLRTSYLMAFTDEYNQYLQEFGITKWEYDTNKEEGELVLIHLSGEAPIKDQYFVDVPVPGKNVAVFVRLAFPKFVVIEPLIKSAEITIGNITAKSVIAEDIAKIAVKNLEDRIARISAKAISRVVAKYAASQGIGEVARDKGGDLAGMLVTWATQTAANIIEQADTRSWRTLPSKINVARVRIPEGSYNIEIRFKSDSGRTIDSALLNNISIKKNKIRFIIYRTFS